MNASHLIIGALAMTLAAESARRVRTREINHGTDDGGCTETLDVTIDGCTRTFVRDHGSYLDGHTEELECNEIFTSCGELLQCACKDVRRDAGVYLPDGGVCWPIDWSRQMGELRRGRCFPYHPHRRESPADLHVPDP